MGVISYGQTATASSQEFPPNIATSTTIASLPSLATKVAASSASSAVPSPTDDEHLEDLPNLMPLYFVVLAIPVIFVLVACFSLLLDRREAQRKAANREQEEIELSNLERHWFPWREALQDDEAGDDNNGGRTARRWVRPPPPPRPDRRTRKERKRDEAARARARGKDTANTVSSSTRNTAAAAGYASRRTPERQRQNSTYRTGGRARTQQRRVYLAPGEASSSRAPTPSETPTEWPLASQFAENGGSTGPGPSRQPRQSSRQRDRPGDDVFVVGSDTEDEEEERPGRPGARTGSSQVDMGGFF